jgi:hypothetical protein
LVTSRHFAPKRPIPATLCNAIGKVERDAPAGRQYVRVGRLSERLASVQGDACHAASMHARTAARSSLAVALGAGQPW